MESHLSEIVCVVFVFFHQQLDVGSRRELCIIFSALDIWVFTPTFTLVSWLKVRKLHKSVARVFMSLLFFFYAPFRH